MRQIRWIASGTGAAIVEIMNNETSKATVTVYTINNTSTGKRLVQTYSTEADAIRDCAIVNRWDDMSVPRYQVERSMLDGNGNVV